MRRTLQLMLMMAVLAVGFVGFAAPSGAAPTVPAACKAAYPGTVGECISGYYYGNTSNPRPSGNGVLPSLAPGPWTCVYTAGCTGAQIGNPVGYYNGGGTPVGHSNGEFPFETRTEAIYG